MATAALASVERAESVRIVIVRGSTTAAGRIRGFRGGYTLGIFLGGSRFVRILPFDGGASDRDSSASCFSPDCVDGLRWYDEPDSASEWCRCWRGGSAPTGDDWECCRSE